MGEAVEIFERADRSRSVVISLPNLAGLEKVNPVWCPEIFLLLPLLCCIV